MQIDHQRAAMRYQNKVNNAQGHFFEQAIKAACALYASRGRATADKTPEPFRVLEKSRDGIFKGRFTARAQPDFQGTLAGGRSIVFEAKYTTTDRLKWDVLTQEQRDALEHHHQHGAISAVCAGIGNDFFFRPARKIAVYRTGDVVRVEVEGAGRGDIPAAVKAAKGRDTEDAE